MCAVLRIEQLEAEVRYWKQKANDLERCIELEAMARGVSGFRGRAAASHSFQDAVRALDEADRHPLLAAGAFHGNRG